MAQLSRPYQIVLGVAVVFGLIWAVALRGHTSSPSEPTPASSSASTPATSTPTAHAASAGATAGTKGVAAPTRIYHGAAPGVEGLTRAIAKAHGAVATSQQNAQQLESKSKEVAGEAQSTPSNVAPVTHPSAATTEQSLVAAELAHKISAQTHSKSGSSSKPHSGRSAQQIAVESELAHGKTVMLLFWDPKSTVDREVLSQASTLAGGSKGGVTLHTAFANQVNAFGKITEVVHVYQTPTILIVNRHGLVSTLTGLTDVFALEQAVREARSAGA